MRLLCCAVLLAAGAGISGCAHRAKVTVLKLDSRLSGGGEAAVSLEVPGGWYSLPKKADRAEFLGPDNFSRVVFAAAATNVAREACEALSLRAVNDLVADLSKSYEAKPEIAAGKGGADAVDFKLRLVANPPTATDRLVVGRAVCRDGALAWVWCSVGTARERTLGTACESVLASLSVTGTTVAAAPKAPKTEGAVAPAAPPTVGGEPDSKGTERTEPKVN